MDRQQIIKNLFSSKNFTDCINKMEPEHLRDDLKQEVILIICELPDAKLFYLHEQNALLWYTVVTIRNMIKSSTSPFYKKYRQTHSGYCENIADKELYDELQHGELMIKDSAMFTSARMCLNEAEGENQERELKELLEEIALEEIEQLDWYSKELIQLYIKHGNYRAIEEETKIPFSSCYKTIKKALKQIKEKVQNRPVFTKEELRFIQNNTPKIKL